MKVEVYVDGKLVLEGIGRIEEQEEGVIELLVTDKNGGDHFVQYKDTEFEEE